MVVLEETFRVVRHKLDDRTAFLRSVVVQDARVGRQFALGELCLAHLTLAVRLYGEIARQGIHRLGTHAVQTHRFLEGFAVVFATGVQHAHYFHQFAQGDTAAVIANADASVAHVYLNHLALAHAVLVDGVVYTLFDEHVDAVIRVAAVAQFADIHTRSASDMLHVIQVDDVLVAVIHGCRIYLVFFCHIHPSNFAGAKLLLFFDICKKKTKNHN